MSAKWTEADIPDQSGRVAVVTGANSGLGGVTARELARAGARVVLACRNLDKGRAAAELMREHVPDARLDVLALDLADLASVRRFAKDITDRFDALDLLINNAGVMAVPHRRTVDGFEMQFGTNHLGHFALTGLLLPMLLAKDDSRVVTVSSGMHKMGTINFADLQSERRYRKWRAYAQSKLANLLFAFELQRRLDAASATAPRSMAAHPGYAATNLQTSDSRGLRSLAKSIMEIGNELLAQDVEHGALPTLFAATTPDLPGGTYAGPDRMFEQRGNPKVVQPTRAAKDEATARRLWDISSELTGVTYPFPPEPNADAESA
jgi:NAD(P)-dependent dehydrogenase (short-subunit alcohol dehydrogenase family)